VTLREWLEDTHGVEFELVRHFVLRFFDSDLVTHPGQWLTATIGGFSILLPWSYMFVQPLHRKYAHFSSLPVPGPYRLAVRGDELWLLTLMMSAVGLVTAIKWQSLFPNFRDYQALGSLPLRPWQIFKAKLLALLLLATATILTLNTVPSGLFSAVSASRWQFHPLAGGPAGLFFLSMGLACYFVFFGLVALQGVLLNLLPPRPFGRVTGYIQGALVAVMLILIVLSFSIGPETAAALVRPDIARSLPPVWFLGLCQTITGDPDPAMHRLALQAFEALLIAVGLTLLTYLLGYARHRKLMVEGAARRARDRKWTGALLDRLVPNPRQQAIIVFMAKTLMRSSQHRMILMGYGGFGLAIVLSGIIGMRGTMDSAKLIPACFVYAHVIILIFLLIGLRHLFAIPAELRANWTFQITEGEGRRDWLRAVDRFVLASGAAVMLVLPFPFEVKLLGWRAVGESVLFVAFSLLCYEWFFTAWEKLPFTCSYLPGKTPAWVKTLQLLGIFGLLPAINGLLLASLYNRIVFLIVLTVFLAVWIRIHLSRREGWGELRLKYDEAPDPAIHGLNLMA
jgi:hypothetical protein